MKKHLQALKDYVANHKKQFSTGIRIGLGVLVIGMLVAMFLYDNSSLKYTYQPVKACDLLTPTEAQDLLGDKVNGVDKNSPVVDGDVATSKCSYSDLNEKAEDMKFVALAVRSAVYDSGVEKNKTEFATAKSNNDVETVKDLGESAYFNKTNGQLNVLDGQKWIIVSYGVKSAPNSTPMSELVSVARKVLK